MSDSPTPPPGPAPRARVGWLARLALVVLPPLVLVGLAEVALWALGLGGPASRPPLGRGFDPQAAYLARDPDVSGGWVTQLFGDPEREVRIPPRDGRRRVLLLGGSNTALLPERVLQDRLDALHGGGANWEVVNLGRPGYGSARVVILLEQALARLDPDVVVVYSGHNEFVEAGFRFEVDEALGDSEPGGLLAAVSSLRSFRVVERALRPAAAPPKDIDPADHAYGDITWAGTLQVYDAYTENLRRMARSCAAADVPVVFGTVVGNDWAVPHRSETPADFDADEGAKAQSILGNVSTRLIPRRFRLWDKGQSPPRLKVGRWYDAELGAWDPGSLPPHTGPLASPPAWDRGDRREDSIAGALWPDPDGWKSDVRQLVAICNGFMARVELTPEERADLMEAHTALSAFVQFMPDHARAHFLLGQVSWLLGKRDLAATLLHRAAASDCAPRRGNPSTNARVRQVAGEEPGATLFDIAERFRAWSPHGIVGYTVMMDGCHLQPGARRVLLHELAPVVRAVADA